MIVDMGTLEREAKRKRQKDFVQKALLSAIGIAGLLLWSMAAPNTLQLLDTLGGNKYRRRYQLRSVAARLASRGLVRFVKKDGRTYLEVTPAGKKVLALEAEKASLARRAKKRWDGRWRMIVFDIPEKHRKTRDRLRVVLKALGFYQLQGSVWVYPYDCEDLATLLKADLRVGSNVLYTIVERIEYDKHLREHFGLL